MAPIWARAPSAGLFLSFTQEANRPSGLCYRDTENPLRKHKSQGQGALSGNSSWGHWSWTWYKCEASCATYLESAASSLPSSPVRPPAAGAAGLLPWGGNLQSSLVWRVKHLKRCHHRPLRSWGQERPQVPEVGTHCPRTTRQEAPASSEHSREITEIVSIFGSSVYTQGTFLSPEPRACFCLSSSLQPPCGWQLSRPEAHRPILKGNHTKDNS